jgi:hypothetical protein
MLSEKNGKTEHPVYWLLDEVSYLYVLFSVGATMEVSSKEKKKKNRDVILTKNEHSVSWLLNEVSYLYVLFGVGMTMEVSSAVSCFKN